jgi:hypothetical protein
VYSTLLSPAGLCRARTPAASAETAQPAARVAYALHIPYRVPAATNQPGAPPVLPPTHRQHPTFTQLQAHTFMGRVRAPHKLQTASSILSWARSCRPHASCTGLPPADTHWETPAAGIRCPRPTTPPQSATAYMNKYLVWPQMVSTHTDTVQ